MNRLACCSTAAFNVSSQAALRHVCDAIAAVRWQVEKNKDNILPRIMAVSGSYDKLFAEELKKYEPLKVRFIPSSLHPRCLRVCLQMYGLKACKEADVLLALCPPCRRKCRQNDCPVAKAYDR